MGVDIKDKTIKGIFWSGIERFSVQGVQFVLTIVMARLLEPSDYGIIGMLAIFLAVSQLFVDSGFSNALIRKQDRTEADFSTVFYFSICIGAFFYLVLFFISPLIAWFYKTPILARIIKILALTLLFNSFGIIHRAKLIIQVDFKTQTKISLIAVLISGTVGLAMAYNGLGVWALVFQSIMYAGFDVILLWIFIPWRPSKMFSRKSFNNLFAYGSRLLLARLIDTLYRNIYPAIIGKKFQAVDLGYYTRAQQFAQFPSLNLTGIFERVTFPVLSSIQDDDERLRTMYRQYLRMTAFIVFPIMCGFAAMAKPFILLVLTEKWSGIIVLMQLLCLSSMWYPIHAINLTLLQIKGRSDLYLKITVIKVCFVGTIALCITIPLGIIAICTGTIATSLVSLGINTYYTNKIISLSFFKQMKDLLPILCSALIMACIAYFVSNIFEHGGVKLSIGILTGITSYGLIHFIAGSQELKFILGLIKIKSAMLFGRP